MSSQKAIGPSFFDDLSAYGVANNIAIIGQHFGWDAEGNLYFYEDTPAAVESAVEAVYAAHDPTKPSWSFYQEQARAALEDSDVTLLRCMENGVTMPAAWGTYRKALREIVGAVSGDATQPLPTRPTYPSGT